MFDAPTKGCVLRQVAECKSVVLFGRQSTVDNRAWVPIGECESQEGCVPVWVAHLGGSFVVTFVHQPSFMGACYSVYQVHTLFLE